MSAEERIVTELSKHTKGIDYSVFREGFKDPNFVERFTFLITTGEVLVAGWNGEKSKYPEEAAKINKVYKQFSGDMGSVSMDIDNLTQYVKDLFSGKEYQSSAIKKMDLESEPFLITRENWLKFAKKTEEKDKS